MGMPILQVEDVVLSFRTRETVLRALNGASLTVGEGEAVGLVGESGSGKSTLARAALGLNPERTSRHRGGTILIAGRDVTRCSQTQWESLRGNPVAIVFQDPLSFLNPVMRIGRQIAESIRRHDAGHAGRGAGGRASGPRQAAATIARAYPHELSGGMRQRALLATALGCGPRLLDRRRADDRARCDDAGRDSRASARAAREARHGDAAHQPRPRHRGFGLRAPLRDVCGARGRMGRDARCVRPAGRILTPSGCSRRRVAARDAQGRFATIGGDPPHLAELAQGCPFAPRCAQAMAECARSMPDAVSLGRRRFPCGALRLYPKAGLGETGVDHAGAG